MSVAPHSLTALELKALRACRALVVTANLDDQGRAVNGATVRVIVDRDDDHYEVSFIAPSWLNYYSKDTVRESFSYGRCCAHVDHYPQQQTPVTTIIDLLKAGDEVSFDWGIGAYNTQATEPLHVTGDILLLNVRRLVKLGGQQHPKYLTFLLDTRISTDPLSRLISPRS